MDCKYVVSNYNPISGIAVPVAVFDSREEAEEFAWIVLGATEVDGYELVAEVISRMGESPKTE